MEDDSSGPVKTGGGGSVDDLLALVREAYEKLQGTSDPWSLLDRYLGDLATRNGAAHVAKTKQQLGALRAACPVLSTESVDAWRAARLGGEKPSAKRTINMHVGALQTFLRWAARLKLLPRHPLLDFEPLSVAEKDLARRPRAFYEQEFAAFLRAVRQRDLRWKEPQEPVWLFFSDSGLRFKEAAACRRDDVVGDCVVLPARHAKRGRERKIGPLSGSVLAMVLRRRAGEPLLFSPTGKPWIDVGHRACHRLFVRTLDAAGLNQVDAAGRLLTIHSLRRTAASNWWSDGVESKWITVMMGHASTAFTERYYIDSRPDDAVAAVRRARKEKERRDASSTHRPDF